MHECVGASQGYHGVYRAAQTVLSRCCHGYSGIPTPVGQIPYLPHRQEPTNHPTANPNPNPPFHTHDSPPTRQHTHACTVTDSVGHSTCMSVLERRRAIMGSIVQPKRSCLGAATGTAESPHRWGKYHTHTTAKNPPTTQPLTLTLTHQPLHDSHRQEPTNHPTANPNPR